MKKNGPLCSGIITISPAQKWPPFNRNYWPPLLRNTQYSSSLLKNNQFTVIKRPPNEDGDLSTSCASNEIYVYIERSDYVQRGLQYREYLKSALYHEKFHLVERLACPAENTFKSINEHIQVYYNQFQQPGFSTKLKSDWIKGLYITVSDKYIDRLNKNYSKEANEWRNMFKALNLDL